jgi:hypothetical protein
MFEPSNRLTARHWITSSVLVLLACTAGTASADRFEDRAPTFSSSDSMDDHMAQSENLDDHLAESSSPDDLEVGSENLDDSTVESRSPDEQIVESGRMENHEGSASNLSDLKQDAPDRGAEEIAMPGQNDWDESSDPTVIAARKRLVDAQQRASAARERYGKMMQTNYPRGTAREEIVQERDASMQALAEANAALRDTDGGVPASSW